MAMVSRAVESTEVAARRFDLAVIESSLRAVQKEFSRINPRLRDRRDFMLDEVVANMIFGYGFVDDSIVDGSDLFAMGQLKQLLEINALVLCGRDGRQRERYAALLRETEDHFYGEAEAGIRDVVEWYARHRHEPVWERAAGVYIRVLSEPQLFLEGNHRSGALIVSYILGREGHPPFVLTVDNAQAYFDPSTLMKQTKKRSIAMRLRMPRLKRTFAGFLEQQSDDRYLTALR